MPRVFLPQILWHSKDNKRCDRVYSIDFQPKLKDEFDDKSKNTTTLRLATGGADEFVHIWQITIHDHAPQYTHFVNNNQSSDNKLEFEQPLSIKILARLIGHIGEVNSVRWSHDGRTLATGGEDRCIFLWVKSSNPNNLNEDGNNDYEEYWTRTHYFRLSNVVNSICWCPDDRVLSVSTEDGHISLVDTQVEGTGKIRYFDGHTSFAQGVSLDPKNELLASLGSDQCLRVWKRRNQKSWKSILVLKAARDRGDIITMNELETNIELRKYSRFVFMSEELKTFFRRLDWSPDGRLLVAPTGIRHDKNTQPNTNTHNNHNMPSDTNNQSTTDSVNNASEDHVSDPNNTTNQGAQAASEKNNTNTHINGESTVYTLYVFHRKLLNFGIPMLTHQSPMGPFVVVKFCPLYLSVFDKKRQNFYNLLLNANKNKMKPIKRKMDRSSKSQFVTTNKINSYFSSVISKPSDNPNNNENEELLNEEDNEDMNEEYEYGNNETGQDEKDEVMTILQENSDNMDVNMENTTTDTPHNLDNTSSPTDINLDEYESSESNDPISNSITNTPITTTRHESRAGAHNTYGSFGEIMESAEAGDRLLTTSHNEEVITTLDDYPANTTTNEADNTEEFQVESMNEWEVDDSRPMDEDFNREEEEQHEAEMAENDSSNEVKIANADASKAQEDSLDHTQVKQENLDYVSVKQEGENYAHVKQELDSEFNMERVEDEYANETAEAEPELEKMDDGSANEEPGDAEVKEEGVDEDAKEQLEGGLVKEEDQKVYNLRKTRKSVVPLMIESYKQVAKKTKNKVKKEKKVKSEAELQDEDYDTDLEEELSIPRFLFAAGTTDGSLCFFDTNENSGPIAVLKNLHFCPITDISWSSDGYVCSTSSSDGYITFIIFNKRELS